MSRKITAMVLIFSIMLSFCVSAADVTVAVQYNTQEESISIGGRATSDISITVLKEGTTPDEIAQSGALPSYFRFVQPQEGVYSHSFKLADGAAYGKYYVYVSSRDGDTTGSFMRINNDVSSDVLDAVNGASTLLQLTQAAETYAEELGVDKSAPLYEQNKATAFGIILAGNKRYETAAQFYYDNLTAFAVAAAVKSETAEIELENNALSLGIDFSADFENDSRLTEGAKSKLTELIKKADWDKIYSNEKREFKAVFKEEFERMRAFAAVSASETALQLQKLTTEGFAEDFADALSGSCYKKLKSREEFFSLLKKSSYSDFDSFVAAFETAARKRYDEENKSTQTGSKNSGTGGGGSIGNVGVPAVVENTAPVALKTPFTDLADFAWAKESIESLYEKKIINGRSESTFAPAELVTRAEFAKMTVTMLGLPTDSEKKIFEDVRDSWSSKYIAAAYDNELISGISEKLFAPQENITREQATVILFRALKEVAANDEAEFSDSDNISEYAREAVAFMSEKKIISGRDNGEFDPLGFMTRAEAAVIIENTMKYKG